MMQDQTLARPLRMVPGVARLGPRLFATSADEPRARRATDIVGLILAAAALAALSTAAVPGPGFARALGRFLTSLPNFLDGLWQTSVDLVALLALILVVLAAVRRRWSVARDVAAALIGAFVVSALVGRATMGSWPEWWETLRSAGPPAWYPAPRVALPAAAIMTASPHLALPLRRLGRWLVGAAALASVALGAATPQGAVGALLVAVIVAAVIHLAFGSSAGRPSLTLVSQALAELGVSTNTIGVADRQPAGQFLLRAHDDDAAPLVVKVYGRDAHDSALVTTLWRTVWLREGGSTLRLGRSQQVEHEAFLTLFAGQAGVPTDAVVTAGTTMDDDALLVLRRTATPLAASTGCDERLAASDVWGLLRRLHDAGIAHGQVDVHHLTETDQGLGLIDFDSAAIGPNETQRRTDEAQAMLTTVALFGEEPAVAAARVALGSEGLSAMLRFLQLPVMTRHQREWVRAEGIDLDQLRERTADAAEVEAPPLHELRRVTPAQIVGIVLPAIAVVALVSAIAGLDFTDLSDQLADARWWLVALGLIVIQLPRLTQAVSTLGSVPVPLPLGPVYALQLAVSYVNLVIPSTAGRIALNIRFFQRHGLPPGTALASGAIDGFSGFIVQAVVLTFLLGFTSASLDLDLGNAAGAAGRLLVLAVIIAAVAITVLVLVPRLRRFVLSWARRIIAEASHAVRGLHSPRRIFLLFGGNLASEILFAFALGVFTRGLGYPVGLGELLLINISVSLLSGVMPVPGGIGVAEAGLTSGLVRAGMPAEPAFAAVMMFRLASFYLPPIWGYGALRWLQRREHV